MSGIFSLNNKIVIITGGGNGIGNYLAENMAKLGATIYAIDKKFPIKIPTELQENLFYKICNIRNRNKFRKIVKDIFLHHKQLDVLINNAGVGFINTKNVFYPINKWNETLEINLTSAFNCTQDVLSYMIKKKNGSIINMTSLNSELAFPNNPAYVASKGGLKMLSKSFARDFGKYGIRVNNLAPGYILTDLTQKSYDDKKIRKLREKRTMLGRWGQKHDLLGPCVFLASDASKYVTGQDIFVDGGWSTNGLSEE